MTVLDHGECVRALKPSYFNSKIHAGSSKGVARFRSGIGLEIGMHAETNQITRHGRFNPELGSIDTMGQ